MEFASFLAGERWTDHPKCTHPLLAALARAVNDCTSDAGRIRLVPLIPSVVGLTTDDPRADVAIALHCARTALPVLSADLARVMAVSVLACERYLAELDGRPADDLRPESRAALRGEPAAEGWARDFLEQVGKIDYRSFGKSVGASTVRQAVLAIAHARVDNDHILHELLAGAISECAAIANRDAARGTSTGRRLPAMIGAGRKLIGAAS